MKRKIRITVHKEQQPDGRMLCMADCDPNALQDLCFALISNRDLCAVAKLATAQIIAMSPDPDKDLNDFNDMVLEIKEEIKTNLKTTS